MAARENASAALTLNGAVTEIQCGQHGGNADDQARSRENTVIGPENDCSQPTNAINEVVLRMPAKCPTSAPVRQI